MKYSNLLRSCLTAKQFHKLRSLKCHILVTFVEKKIKLFFLRFFFILNKLFTRTNLIYRVYSRLTRFRVCWKRLQRLGFIIKNLERRIVLVKIVIKYVNTKTEIKYTYLCV